MMVGFIFGYAVVIIVQLPSVDVEEGTADLLTTLSLLLSPGAALSEGLSRVLLCQVWDVNPWQVGYVRINEFTRVGTLGVPVISLFAQSIAFGLVLLKCEDGTFVRLWEVRSEAMKRCEYFAFSALALRSLLKTVLTSLSLSRRSTT